MLGSDQDESSLKLRRRSIDALAFNAREDRRPQDAEKIYRDAIADLPDAEAAYFHFQLGRHYELGGRPRDALAELQTAARLNPVQFARPVAVLIDSMRVNSPACVLAPPVVLEESRLPKRIEETIDGAVRHGRWVAFAMHVLPAFLTTNTNPTRKF